MSRTKNEQYNDALAACQELGLEYSREIHEVIFQILSLRADSFDAMIERQELLRIAILSIPKSYI